MEKIRLRASSDGIELGVALVVPQQPKGIVQLVHGMCEHKERYYPFMDFLAENGYVAVINDLRGHGESVKAPEDLGYFYDGGWEAMVEDEKIVNDYVRGRFPGLPLTLFGHSMGSMVVRSYIKRYDDTVDRLFVCGSPSSNPASGAALAMCRVIAMVKGWRTRPAIMQKLSFGTFNKPFEDEGYPSAWVCSDREVLEAYHHDPLCQYVFTANGFYNLMGLMRDCYSTKGWKISNPSLPVHFISGAQDPCRTDDGAFYSAVRKMKEAGYTAVDSKLYPGMRHEILNETRKAEVWNDILGLLA